MSLFYTAIFSVGLLFVPPSRVQCDESLLFDDPSFFKKVFVEKEKEQSFVRGTLTDVKEYLPNSDSSSAFKTIDGPTTPLCDPNVKQIRGFFNIAYAMLCMHDMTFVCV